MDNNKISLFESGIGNADDLLISFPSSEQLLKEGSETFNIIHRNRGYDKSKIIKYHPRQHFTFTVKAEYEVKQLSSLGLIDFNVFMLKPHNYKFKLTAYAKDKSNIEYFGEWTLEGTIDRNTMNYTVVEFDDTEFIPKNYKNEPFNGLNNEIEYTIENILDDTVLNICFEDGTKVSNGFKFIKAKTIAKDHFQDLIREEKGVVASLVPTEFFIDRSLLSLTVLNMWEYTNQDASLDIGYGFYGKLNGLFPEWGVTAETNKGMDFPYKYSFYTSNPWLGNKDFHFEDFYHNIDAKDVELIKQEPLTKYEKQIYTPDIHGHNEIKISNYNTNIGAKIEDIAPNYIVEEVDVYMLDENTNELNINHILKSNITGATKLGGYKEKEIMAEHIYDNKIFRVFKLKTPRMDELHSYSVELFYEIIDIGTNNCIANQLLAKSDETCTIANAQTTNDFFIAPGNVYLYEDKIYLITERVVEILKSFDDNTIDNFVLKYDINKITIDLFSLAFKSKCLVNREYDVIVPNYYKQIDDLYINQGQSKMIIYPSCKSSVFNGDKDRIDIIFKEIIANKNIYMSNVTTTSALERFNLFYINDIQEKLINVYTSTNQPLVNDYGDTIGIASSDFNALIYYKLYDLNTKTAIDYLGKEINIDTGTTININFCFDGVLKVLYYNGAYVVFRFKNNELTTIKLDTALTLDISLNDKEISNNYMLTINNFDTLDDTIFTSTQTITNSKLDFKRWYNVDEVIQVLDYTYRNDNLISQDRFHYEYTNGDDFISTQVRGDFLDFMLNYNSSQLEIKDNKIVWFGIANTLDTNKNNIAYAFKSELNLIGFDSIYDNAQVYNNLSLNVTELFEVYYQDNATKQDWSLINSLYKPEQDIWFNCFVFNGKVTLYNQGKETIINFDSNFIPVSRPDYINEITYNNYSIILPEDGYLIGVDDYQEHSIICLYKTPTNKLKLIDNPKSLTEKLIPVKERFKQRIFDIKIYNFKGIINKITARYSTTMPYEPGDVAVFDVNKIEFMFRGKLIPENKTYASLEHKVNNQGGERICDMIAYKKKDMKYHLKVDNEFYFFDSTKPSITDYYSKEYRPLLSINDTEFEHTVDDSCYVIDYIRDYVTQEDYLGVIDCKISDSRMYIVNNLVAKDYNIRFDNKTKQDVSVNKRDVFNISIDANLFDAPLYKDFVWPYTPLEYDFDIQSSNPWVKSKYSKNKITVFTNYDNITQEEPKHLKAQKIGGHTNSYIFWRDNDTDIAKVKNDYVLSRVDEVLIAQAREEDIIITSNKYSNYLDGDVNGVADDGTVIETMMLSDEEFVKRFLNKEGKQDCIVPLKNTGILGTLPDNIVGAPIYSITVDNSLVEYVFDKPYSDIGLDDKHTRQEDAVIRLFSKYKTSINLSEETKTKELSYGPCTITNSQMQKEFVIPVDNPKKTSFYFPNGKLASNITEYILEIFSDSENIYVDVDYIKTLNNIDSSIITEGKTQEQIWDLILDNSEEGTIQIFVTASIVFPDQVNWSPKINIGTYYLNNQEFELLPDKNDNISITASDELSFKTSPVPVENSPIELINDINGLKYTRVYFTDINNNYTLTNTEKVYFKDNYTAVLECEDIDIKTIVLDIDREVDFIASNIIRLKNPIESDTLVTVKYQIINSFTANIDSRLNAVSFNVHSVESKSKFKVNYSSDDTLNTYINVNPLTSYSTGFMQINSGQI